MGVARTAIGLLAGLAALGCACTPVRADELTLYSTREANLVEPVVAAFTAATGTKVNTVFIEDSLVKRLTSEGDNSLADVLLTIGLDKTTQLAVRGLTQAIASPAYLRRGNFTKNEQSSMIVSMTGFGRGEASKSGTTATAEVRSVNSRYLEVTTRLPRIIALRENEVKDLIRTKFVRGKINISVSIISENGGESPLRVNKGAAKLYYSLLNDLRKAVKIQEKVSLTHLLQFPDVLEVDGLDKGNESEWGLVKKSLTIALDEALQI